MKLADFPMAEALISTRAYLLEQRNAGRVVIEIDQRRLAPNIAQRLRPAITAELDRQIDELDEELRKLGVDPG